MKELTVKGVRYREKDGQWARVEKNGSVWPMLDTPLLPALHTAVQALRFYTQGELGSVARATIKEIEEETK